MASESQHKLATRAAHAGTRGERPDYAPTVAPIHPSVSFIYDDMADLDGVFAGERPGYVYARYGNPTVAALEQAVAALEGGDGAVAFGSGMAAIHACLLAVGARAGTAIVAAQDVYGGTFALLDQVLKTQGVHVEFVDVESLERVRDACLELRPTALLVETISNPLLKVADLPALAEIAQGSGAVLVADSTFATPCLCRPMDFGADLVVHSATKYLAGHGDVLGGIVVASAEVCAALREIQKVTGGNLGPQEAWLATRGLRTLALRVPRQCENGLDLARWLERRPEVSRVIYPGLVSHPQHVLAARLFEGRGFGGMISFELARAGQAEVFRFFEALRLCLPATTLGDVCTLVLYPAHSSHRALGQEERDRIGIGPGLVRMSVGIEELEDLKEDLAQALAAV